MTYIVQTFDNEANEISKRSFTSYTESENKINDLVSAGERNVYFSRIDPRTGCKKSIMRGVNFNWAS